MKSVSSGGIRSGLSRRYSSVFVINLAVFHSYPPWMAPISARLIGPGPRRYTTSGHPCTEVPIVSGSPKNDGAAVGDAVEVGLGTGVTVGVRIGADNADRACTTRGT